MIASSSDKIKVSVDGHVATLTIDNPAANTWDTESLPALQAIVEALKVDRPSKQHVMNCLSRISDAPQPKPSLPPPALKLVTEPMANTQRYDRLRRSKS